ncbi:MAG: hypothetical protein IKR13_06720, partial [Victivallales bacterium]|nr:hypothetical protein [Victivallales bacterium]
EGKGFSLHPGTPTAIIAVHFLFSPSVFVLFHSQPIYYALLMTIECKVGTPHEGNSVGTNPPIRRNSLLVPELQADDMKTQ